MALQIAPETESRVRERAARDGISIDELLNRFLAPVPPLPSPAPAEPAATETQEETRVRVQGLLHKWQSEYGLPVPPGGFKTLAELFAEWEEEDANKTPEEVEEDHIFWEEYQQSLEKWPLHI